MLITLTRFGSCDIVDFKSIPSSLALRLSLPFFLTLTSNLWNFKMILTPFVYKLICLDQNFWLNGTYLYLDKRVVFLNFRRKLIYRKNALLLFLVPNTALSFRLLLTLINLKINFIETPHVIVIDQLKPWGPLTRG